MAGGGLHSAERNIENYSLALVQSEMEALHTPNLDLSVARLGSRPATLFTERNVQSLLETTDQFDCIVIGFNALYQSRHLREAFEERLPETGLIILHQLQTDALALLKNDLALRVRRLERQVEVCLAQYRDPLDEVLLNWPNYLCAGGPGNGLRLKGRAHASILPSLDGAWRTVLEAREVESACEASEVEGAYPVLVRTTRTHVPRICVCYLWLEPRQDSHMRLLENMISFCAAGVPEVAILTSPSLDGGVEEVAQRLKLYGQRLVSVDRIDFDRWPLRHCRQLVVPDDPSSPADAALALAGPWMRRGDAAVVVVGKDGELRLHYRTPDEEWIQLRWAAWFNAVPPQTWFGGVDQYGEEHRGRVFRTRAVLRVLKQLESVAERRQSEDQPLGLKPAIHYQAEVAQFFATTDRWKGASLDETISTTAAAEDIDRLLGRKALPPGRRRRMIEWLRKEFPSAGVEDKLDIARCLKDKQLFEEAQRSISLDPMAPALATKLREAAVVCGEPRSDLLEAKPEAGGSGLQNSLLLACQYLEAAVAFARRFPDHPLASTEGSIEAALRTIGLHGQLLHIDDPETPLHAMEAETVGAEALALVAYFGRNPATTHVLAEGGVHIPVAVADEVFRETSSSRAKLTEAREELAKHRSKLRSLKIAQYILGVLAGLAAGTVFVLTHRSYVWAAATFLGISAVWAFFGLSAPWTAWVFRSVLSGPQGLLSAIGDRLFPLDERK